MKQPAKTIRRLLVGAILLSASMLPAAANAQSASAAAQAQRAKQALASGNYDQAIAIYGALSRLMPEVGGLHLNLGMALHSAGKYKEAVTELDRALKLDPNLAAAALFLGLAHAKLGQPAAAIEPLKRYLKADPESAVPILELGDAYLATGSAKLAVAQFQHLVRLEPRNPKAWRGLGLGYSASSRNAFAKLPEDSPAALVLLANSKLRQQQPKAAFALLKKAVEKNPELPGAHAALAEVYRQTGHADWAAAEEARERAIRRKPEGLYAEALAASAGALESYTHLAELPASSELFETESDAARLTGAFKKSIEALRKAIALSPANMRLQQELARSLWLDRNYEEAIPLLTKFVMKYELGFALLESGRAAEAVPLLESSTRGPKPPVEAFAALGKAYLQAGEPAKAVAPLKAALATDQDGSLYFQLARAYQRGGQSQLAKEMDEKSQQLREKQQMRGEQTSGESEITPP